MYNLQPILPQQRSEDTRGVNRRTNASKPQREEANQVGIARSRAAA